MGRLTAILAAIGDERVAQQTKAVTRFDATNTLNDYVAYATAYLGRAAEKVDRNDREVVGSKRAMLIKVAALCVAAIENLNLPE